MVELKVARDANGVALYGAPITDAGQVCNLTADTDTSFTVPANARLCMFGFSSANDYWVGSSTVTIPSSGTPASANFLLNPPPLIVSGVATLHVRAPVSCTISLAFYS